MSSQINRPGCICTMTRLIMFRCPQTDLDVQTLLDKQEKEEVEILETYEAVICPACTRLHFINKSTGKALGSGADLSPRPRCQHRLNRNAPSHDSRKLAPGFW